MENDDKTTMPIYQNLRTGSYNQERHIAEDMVESGQCGSYDEAYRVLHSMHPGECIQTVRGYVSRCK